jgi:hypothetical protein
MAKKASRKVTKKASKTGKKPTKAREVHFEPSSDLYELLMQAFDDHGVEPVIQWVHNEARIIRLELKDRQSLRKTLTTSEIMQAWKNGANAQKKKKKK